MPAKQRAKEPPEQAAPRRVPLLVPLAAAAYAAVVLLADALAALDVQWLIDWSMLRWTPPSLLREWGEAAPLSAETREWLLQSPWRRFDFFKFFFWFLLPFLICLPWMDWGAWGIRRWKLRDWVFLLVLSAVGMGTMLLIPMLPGVREYYQTAGSLTPEQQWAYAAGSLVWFLAWLPGWEFLHRYFLLWPASSRWPRYGWLIVPLFEGLYHLQKPGLEVLGMVVFSIVLTQWTLNRRNILLPLLVHFIFEIELVLFQLFF